MMRSLRTQAVMATMWGLPLVIRRAKSSAISFVRRTQDLGGRCSVRDKVRHSFDGTDRSEQQSVARLGMRGRVGVG